MLFNSNLEQKKYVLLAVRAFVHLPCLLTVSGRCQWWPSVVEFMANKLKNFCKARQSAVPGKTFGKH